jgi:hypothetical protein
VITNRAETIALVSAYMMPVMIALTVFVFPVVALGAWHTRGRRGLLIVTVAAILAVLGCAFVLTSGAFANNAAASRGYYHRAMFAVAMFLPLYCFPLTVAAILTDFLGRRWQSNVAVYGLVTIVSTVATVLGMVIMLAISGFGASTIAGFCTAGRGSS